LDHHIREDLNHLAPRIHCVQDPLPVTLSNWPNDHVESLSAPYWPHDIPREGSRTLPFSGELFIERGDFSEDPPKGFKRLTPGGIVRLRHAYMIRCTNVEKDDHGHVTRLVCEWIEGTQSGTKDSDLKPKGTIHWVDAHNSSEAIVRVYQQLLSVPSVEDDLWSSLNPFSLIEHRHARMEPSVTQDSLDQRYQFVRLGYYWRDGTCADSEKPIFNCIVALRDSSVKKDASSQPSQTQVVKDKTLQKKSTADQRPLTPNEEQWLRRSGLNRAVGLAIYGVSEAVAFFDAASASAPRVSVGNWMANHLLPALKGQSISDLPFGPNEFAELVQLADREIGSAHEIRETLKRMFDTGEHPAVLLSTIQESFVSDPETQGRFQEWLDRGYSFKITPASELK